MSTPAHPPRRVIVRLEVDTALPLAAFRRPQALTLLLEHPAYFGMDLAVLVADAEEKR